MRQMVDRIARVIYLSFYAPRAPQIVFDDCPGFVQDEWRNIARAAIAEMREPTDEMVQAGIVEDPACVEIDAQRMWQAMIDEALKP